jgi:hypothetical protein
MLLLAALACAVAVGACGGSSSARRTVCLPSPLHIEPGGVEAGGTMTVSSARFPCRGSYPAGHGYSLILGQVGRAAPLGLGVFPVRRDGAFRAVLHIPQSASPGQSYIIVRGSPFDRCTDTNGMAVSCAGYDAPVHVLRSSSIQAPSTGGSSCGTPFYTFTLPGGRQVSNGDCPGYLYPKPPALTVRRGETFTVTPGDAAMGVPPVPRPNGSAVVVLSLHRTPHAGTRATYRAVAPGRSQLLVPEYRRFCSATEPKLGCSASALVVLVAG